MHDEHHMHHAHAESGASAVDPVCGMAVDAEAAGAAGLVSDYDGTRHYFCGRGCKLEFDEDPARYSERAARRSK